jgi:hypothetical protein
MFLTRTEDEPMKCAPWVLIVVVAAVCSFTLAKSNGPSTDGLCVLGCLPLGAHVEGNWSNAGNGCSLLVVEPEGRMAEIAREKKEREEALKELAEIREARRKGQTVDEKKERDLRMKAAPPRRFGTIYEVVRIGVDCVELKNEEGQRTVLPQSSIRYIRFPVQENDR